MQLSNEPLTGARPRPLDNADPPVGHDAEERWARRLAVLTVTALVALVAGAVAELGGLPPALATALFVVAYAAGGYAGFVNGWSALRRGELDVNVLMLVAAAGAAVIGDWLEGAVLLFLFSLSETLQVYALGRTRHAVRALMRLRPDTATLQTSSGTRRVPVEALALGDIVVVRPGERLPADGVVVSGESDVDQSPITGESMPVPKAPGADVFTASINGSGVLEVRVTKSSTESTLARIIVLVSEAQSSRAPTQRIIDRFGDRYARLVIAASVLMFIVPVLLLGWTTQAALYRAMTLLVVASPCALVISTPASYLSAIANAARHGVLFKGGAFLEAAAAVRAVAIDKTGTLTFGRPAVTDVISLDGRPTESVLALAAAVERHSEHLLGQAVVAEAARRGLSVADATGIRALPGLGIQARVAGELVTVAAPRFFAHNGDELPAEVAAQVRLLEDAGKSTMVVADARPIGLVAVADQVRPSAAATLALLRAAGIQRVVMVTGDNARVAHGVAAQVGISAEDVFAELLPAEKVLVVDQLARDGPVSFVGDGVNDAPALATASLGVAMGVGGTDVALETADVVLMSDQLERLGHVFGLGRAARRVVLQNVTFSVAVIAVLVTATVVKGIPLPLGVVAHEGSTVLVVLNGLRLLGFRGWR